MQYPTIEYVIIRTFTESILFMLAGFILLDLKINFKKIFMSGIVLGLIVAIIKYLPFAYGIHTVLAMMVGGFLLTKITKLPLDKNVMATCGIFVSLALSEGIYVFIAGEILNIELETLTRPDAEGAITSLPSLAIFMIIIVILRYGINKLKIKSMVN